MNQSLKTSLKVFLLVLMLTVISGCNTFPLLENQLYITISGDECGINSKWGVFGISANIRQKDCDSLIRMSIGDK